MNDIGSIIAVLALALLVGSLAGCAIGYSLGFNAGFDYWAERIRREEQESKS